MDKNKKSLNIVNKYELLKFANIKTGSFIDKIDPTFKLLNNFSEINTLLDRNSDKFKFIYFNKANIKQILYDNEEYIILDSDIKENTLNKLFYLSLLVTDNIEIVNYKYSIDYIKQLNELNEKNSLKLRKIIFSKIILDLINYFIGFEEYNESTKSSIDYIKNKNIDIIKNNNNILKEFNLEGKDLINKSIEVIYIDIIKIILHECKDYKYIHGIINELDLEEIDITNFIFKEILIILSNDKSIKEKSIENINDLFNEDKIEFYYLLLKYILKNSCYIYQIPFLIDARAFILKNMKSIKGGGYIYKEKLEYLINTLTGSKYYFKHFGILQNDKIYDCKIENNNNDKLEEDQKMGENYQKENDTSNENNFQVIEYETQLSQNDTTRLETSKKVKTKYKGIGAEQYEKLSHWKKISYLLEDIIIHYRNNQNDKEINILIIIEEKEKEKEKIKDKIFMGYDDLIELKKKIYFFDMNEEQLIKYASFVKLINFIQKIDEYISEEYKDKNFDKISLKLKHKKSSEKQNKNGIYNISCTYVFFSKKKKIELNYKDENILLNGFSHGFLALLYELNDSL